MNLKKWQKDFINQHPMYQTFSSLPLSCLYSEGWPDLKSYNRLLNVIDKNIQSQSEIKIKFVEQNDSELNFEDQYEPRIYLRGEILTRKQNWHDFFNMLVWLSFPLSKSKINAAQYFFLKHRFGISTSRASRENALTLFDENGAIVVSSNLLLLNMIADMEWKKLFWDHRSELQQYCRCFIFGHSLYEKGLDPYIGMTAHALLIQVSAEFWHKTSQQQLDYLDTVLTELLEDDNYLQSPKSLYPVPILGFPGWHPENVNEAFYHDKNYFRQRSGRD